ncbi:hypothetical protein O6H91_13G027100 [Diphasiastrum complanatum]|uniref:Uncharacterized protein n=2 Tax=Diphasiastrum complanatum TaxID=34168 RepID=A0ACC2BT61_DIPCM|nr:hypothetical protein O6H91_13G027100 [Diphasiastrum complanatum]
MPTASYNQGFQMILQSAPAPSSSPPASSVIRAKRSFCVGPYELQEEESQPEFQPSRSRRGQASRTQQLWEEILSDPSQWWDNKSDDKRKPRFPDFKHRTAKKALWIHDRLNPPWVHARRAAFVQCQEQGESGLPKPEIAGRIVKMEQLWQEFFSDPSRWWDNRLIKEGRNYPDFKHKITNEGLWVENWLNPPWVEAKMATMALGQTQSGGGLTQRLSYSLKNGDNVSKLCREGRLKDALHIVELMVKRNIQAPINAYVGLLKGCTRSKALAEGKRVHALIVQSGLHSDIFLGSTLVNMYAKCGSVLDAREVFNKMPEHNVFSWTAIIAAYADYGPGGEAINLFQQMQQTGIAPDKVAFVVVLKACARIGDLEQGKQLHSNIIKSGLESDVTVGNTLVSMYAKCGCIEDAHEVFVKMNKRNVVSWNAMVAGYAQQGRGKEALALYEQMKQEGVQMNDITFVALLNACASIAALEKGKQLHSHIIRSGFESDLKVGTALVDMYAKCGIIEHARQVFNRMSERDVVSWSAMIAGYAQQRLGKEALALYEQMKQEDVQPNKVVYVVLLNACASAVALEQGKQLHSDIIRSDFESDVIVGNTLIDMYAKCGCMEDAREVFNKMNERDVISWTAMIAGYARQGLASVAALEQGKQLHSDIIKSGFKLDVITGNSLIDMYAKCGSIEDAHEVFVKMNEQDVGSWTAMIAGYAHQGLGKEALTFLGQMRREGIKPNEATYVSVLSACSHSGLVNEGRYLFGSMCRDHGVTPTVDHYACMVDLLGRAGCLADAKDFIDKMPIQPNSVIWIALLGAAKNHGQVEMGRRAFDCVVKLEPENAAAYVLLSNIYAAAGRRDEVEKIRKEMKVAGLKESAWMQLD